jgi:hypothetical protein
MLKIMEIILSEQNSEHIVHGSTRIEELKSDLPWKIQAV